MMTLSLMKSTPASAMFCTPLGTSDFLRPAMTKIVSVIAIEAMNSTPVLFRPRPNDFQSTISPIGGNSRANMCALGPLVDGLGGLGGLQSGERQRGADISGLPD